MTTKYRKKQLPVRYSSRVTSKYQATIPKEIRKFLHLESGDELQYELLPNNTVIIRKTSPLDLDYLQALNYTMNEWETDADEKAYKHL